MLETLAEELKTRRQLEAVGGFAYLMQVTGKIQTTAHAGYFIEKVREKHLLRELIKAATGAVEQAYGFTGGLEEFVDKVEQDLFKVTQDRVSDSAQEIKESVKEADAVDRQAAHEEGRADRRDLGLQGPGCDDIRFPAAGNDRHRRPALDGQDQLRALNIAEAAALRSRARANRWPP